MLEWFVSSAVLTAALIALRALLRGRLSPKLQYTLWMLALVRLLVPVSIGKTAVSVGNLLPQAALARTDAELACDEDTIRRLGEDVRAEYGRSLIRMTCRTHVDPLCAATTMSGRGGQLKTRIVSITKQTKTAVPALICVLVLAILAAGCTMTGARDESEPVRQE